MDVPMPIAAGVTPTVAPVTEQGERRRATTPLIFESVERRKATIQKAGVDVMAETRRIQDEATIEGLRAQVKGFAGQIESARVAARAEARAEWEHEMEGRVARERDAVARCCEKVGVDRVKYFRDVEGEVVRLALAIAERVLHRESKMDPMLLTASVRLALEKVAGETGTVLRVPVGEEGGWRGVFGENAAVEVVGDEKLAAGDCVMETTVGRVELGVKVQLEEIEKGFFDLLQKRPA